MGEDSQFLRRFLEGLPAALTPGGEGLLILSDLAVLLGLRPPGWLEDQFARCGLTVAWRKSTLHLVVVRRSDDRAKVAESEGIREVTFLQYARGARP